MAALSGTQDGTGSSEEPEPLQALEVWHSVEQRYGGMALYQANGVVTVQTFLPDVDRPLLDRRQRYTIWFERDEGLRFEMEIRADSDPEHVDDYVVLSDLYDRTSVFRAGELLEAGPLTEVMPMVAVDTSGAGYLLSRLLMPDEIGAESVDVDLAGVDVALASREADAGSSLLLEWRTAESGSRKWARVDVETGAVRQLGWSWEGILRGELQRLDVRIDVEQESESEFEPDVLSLDADMVLSEPWGGTAPSPVGVAARAPASRSTSDPDLDEIFAKVEETYATACDYTDEGVAYKVDDDGEVEVVGRFRASLSRPDYEFYCENERRSSTYELRYDGEEVVVRVNDVEERPETLSRGASSLTGVTFSLGGWIPRLLFPDLHAGFGLTDTDVHTTRRIEDGAIGTVRCARFHQQVRWTLGYRRVVWIDLDRTVILRVEKFAPGSKQPLVVDFAPRME